MANNLSQEQVSAYLSGAQSFIPGLKPSDAVQLPAQQVLYLLEKKLGGQFYSAFNPEQTVESPLLAPQKAEEYPTAWLKRANMVGVNVRTVQSFWNVVKYALTLPQSQSAIHLLPMWEPGVVSSLYGMSSWVINPEFFSDELAMAMPQLNTVEAQLKVTVNVLHALGKTVGMDVIPHTDRFSEQVLANPQCFEWLQRVDTEIVRHENNLHEAVQKIIFEFLQKRTPSVLPASKEIFFSKNFPESQRLKIMFGEPHDYEGRRQRREQIFNHVLSHHFETVPATMAPPYRGLVVDAASKPIVDDESRVWRDYAIRKPQAFSRVFGPLTRYKLYENKNDNADWEIDFSKPIRDNWDYVARHYAEVQALYNLDFMRGDMAHVQMRPEGVPATTDKYYDVMGYIKQFVQQRVPYFASFAETFLAPAGEMAYGDEIDHLEMTLADSTLGDLQSMVVGSPRFLAEFRRYLDILHTRSFAPNFTIMTGDKDDPRFDAFYLAGNEARFFIALFLPEMPSYMGLGFELRDPHPTPAPNEHYTKLYVFHIDKGEKATEGPYVWGQNAALFDCLDRIKRLSDALHGQLEGAACQWLIAPDATGHQTIVAWRCGAYAFAVNLGLENAVENVKIPATHLSEYASLECIFSTQTDFSAVPSVSNGLQFSLGTLAAGEGRVYRLLKK